MMRELNDILNGLSELVYISDADTYELLYMNEPGIKLFQAKNYKGKKCYEILQRRNAPCEFCTNAILSKDSFHTWEFYNETINRHYLLKDKLIPWNGKLSRIEIAFDTTEIKKKSIELEHRLDMETMLINCIKELHKPISTQECINSAVQIIGEFLKADRVYIFRNDGVSMSNTHEWCRKGVSPEINHLQNLSIDLFERWLPYFNQGKCVIIEDLERIKEISPEEYSVLNSQEIHSLVAAPIATNRKLIGFIGIDNPPPGALKDSQTFFTTLSYFLSSVIMRQRNEEMLQIMSYRDSLTKLNNRNRFIQDTEAINAKPAEKIGVIYIDLNGLKDINDRLGHSYGDNALIEIARSIVSIFGETSCYRLGGDEFAVLCTPIEEADFQRSVQYLRKVLEQRSISTAIGVQYVPDICDIHEVIREADERMYSDKKDFYRHNQSAARYRYRNDIVSDFLNKESLLKQLEEHRFPVYLQPILSAHNRTVKGTEALIRYVDKKGTLIPPDRFIPDLEEAGLIRFIDFYVLNQACKYISDWIAEGRRIVPISVNLSKKTLVSDHFVDNLLNVWNQYDISKQMIHLEITEDIQIDSLPGVPEILETLKKAGFTLAIDDFGSRYANLFWFSSLDFDILKLDKSLIRNIQGNSKIRSVIHALTKICHESTITTIAEGIETEKELQLLRDINCDYVQGFLFDRPMPYEKFVEKYL